MQPSPAPGAKLRHGGIGVHRNRLADDDPGPVRQLRQRLGRRRWRRMLPRFPGRASRRPAGATSRVRSSPQRRGGAAALKEYRRRCGDQQHESGRHPYNLDSHLSDRVSLPDMSLRIATRGSALALAQANLVAARLRDLSTETSIEVLPMTTQGDRAAERPLTEIGGKGVFVKELEEALLAGGADAAVHSLKDLPYELPESLILVAFPQREDPRDALALPKTAPRVAGDRL